MYVRLIDANTIQAAPPTWTWPDGSTASNFPQSDPAVLASAGFLPYVDGTQPTPTPTTIVGPPTYTSDGTKVTSAYALVAKPAEQINQEAILAWLASALPTLRTLNTQATALSTVTLTGSTTTALRSEVQGYLRPIGSGLATLTDGMIRAARLLSNTIDGVS